MCFITLAKRQTLKQENFKSYRFCIIETIPSANFYNNGIIWKLSKQGPNKLTTPFISKSLERIADHAVNISKEVVFMATSVDVRHAAKYKKSVLKKKLLAEG